MMVPRILAVLSSSDIVIDVEIIEMVIEPKTQYLRAKAKLKKGYVLYVTEGIGETYRKYSYHLQRDDEMIKRWDNAPHWTGITTFSISCASLRPREAPSMHGSICTGCALRATRSSW